MYNVVKTAAAGAMLGGSLLFTAGVGLANAAPETARDGQVALALGDSVLQNVDAAAAAQIAAAVCDVETGPVTDLVQSVDTDGTQRTVCTNNLGAIGVSQNGTTPSQTTPAQPGAAESGGATSGTTPQDATADTDTPSDAGGAETVPDTEPTTSGTR